MRASRVNYSSKVAPAGAITIERPTHGALNRASTDQHAAIDIQKIGLTAYANSPWLVEIANQHGVDPKILAKKAFDPTSSAKLKLQRERVVESGQKGRRNEYWFGEHIHPRPEPFPNGDANPFDYLPQGYSHGFAKVEQIGVRDSKFIRYGQYLSRFSVSVCLHDICVIPDKQQKGLATALGYVGLKEQPRWLKTKFITAANNSAMRSYGERYGYTQVNAFDETDLFEGIVVPFVTYEAGNVASVTDRMEELHPWLSGGESVSTFWRMLDEKEAETISLNAR